MGSDDLHHKRKLEANRSLARTKNNREPYDRVLIVCEGQKTEPDYLEGLRKELVVNQQELRLNQN